MGRYAIIEDGVVTNVAVAGADFASAQGWIEADTGVGPGWTYADGTFTAPDPEPDPVPTSVTPRQAKLALLDAELLDETETAVEAAGQAAQIEWEYATEFRRDNALIASLGTALGLSADDIDDLFRDAATR